MMVNKQWIAIILSATLLTACASNGEDKNKEADPERAAEIFTDLGLGYLTQGDPELALEKLERALELDESSATAHHYIAEVYRQLEDFEKADEHFREAIRFDAKNPSLLNNYGAFLCGQGRFKDAEKYFLRVANTPRYKIPQLAYENLGLCAAAVGNVADAERYLRIALKIDPELVKSLYQMAMIAADSDRMMSARGFLQRFHAKIGKTAPSLHLAVRVERALGADDLADEYQETLERMFPEFIAPSASDLNAEE